MRLTEHSRTIFARVEGLQNLVFLIQSHADQPDKVKAYAESARVRLDDLDSRFKRILPTLNG